MAKLKITFTQNFTPYNELNVPKTHYKHRWFSGKYLFPYGLQFNKTYYKWENGGLIAFRILAYTFNDNQVGRLKHQLMYLVQVPNKPLEWINDYINSDIKVYNSIDDYIISGGTKSVDLDWRDWWRLFNTKHFHEDTHFFADSFWTINNGAVVEADGHWCNAFVVTEDGAFANISTDSCWDKEQGIYLDKMLATKTLLKDMSVTDFESEPITIKMNILNNTPKYIKIKFVE